MYFVPMQLKRFLVRRILGETNRDLRTIESSLQPVSKGNGCRWSVGVQYGLMLFEEECRSRAETLFSMLFTRRFSSECRAARPNGE